MRGHDVFTLVSEYYGVPIIVTLQNKAHHQKYVLRMFLYLLWRLNLAPTQSNVTTYGSISTFMKIHYNFEMKTAVVKRAIIKQIEILNDSRKAERELLELLALINKNDTQSSHTT